MVSEKVKGKWVITNWKSRIDSERKCYLFTYYLRSEWQRDKDIPLHTQSCYSDNLQETINSLSENEDIVCLQVYEKKEIDFESEK